MSKGKTSIKKSDIDFVETNERDTYVKKRKGVRDLSDFESAMLMLVGNSIRSPKSQHFWSDGCYCWYQDETQIKTDSIWMTKDGAVLFEKATDDENHRIFRIRFNF